MATDDNTNPNEMMKLTAGEVQSLADRLLTQLYQLAHSNGDFRGVPARKRESIQRRPIANRL